MFVLDRKKLSKRRLKYTVAQLLDRILQFFLNKMERKFGSVHNKQNQGGKQHHTNKKQRKSLEIEEMPQKYCFIKDVETQIEHTEPKIERIVDECPPPHYTSHCQTIYHIGEQAFIPVSLQNLKNTLEQRIKHKFLL